MEEDIGQPRRTVLPPSTVASLTAVSALDWHNGLAIIPPMRSASLCLIILVLGAFILAACGGGGATSTLIPAPTASLLVTSTPVTVVTTTGEPTAEPTSAPAATSVLEPTDTGVPQPTPSATATPTVTATLPPPQCASTPNSGRINEGPYYSGPLIDSHLHLPGLFEPPPTLAELIPIGPFPVLGKDVTMEDIICLFDGENITQAIGFYVTFEFTLDAYLQVIKQTEERHPQRIVPFLMPAPFPSPSFDPDTLEDVLSSNKGIFKGYGELAFYIQPFEDTSPDAPMFLQIYDVAARHDIVVMIHPDEDQQSNIERALAHNRDVTFLLHGGDRVEDWITDVLDGHPNAYYSLDANLFPDLYNVDGKEEFLTQFRANFDIFLEGNIDKWKEEIEARPDRFVWGTDRGNTWHFDPEVGALLVEFSRVFIGSLDPEVQEKFAYKNAERLLQGRSSIPSPDSTATPTLQPTLSTNPPLEDQRPSVDRQGSPGDLFLPFRIEDVGGGNEFISPFGIIRHSRDASHGHGGIDIPLNANAPLYAVADGTILSAEESSDGAGGFDVELLLSGSGGEGWGFLYEHIELETGLVVGSAVTRGQLIGRNGLITDHRNSHLQLTYMFNDYKFSRDSRCWVDHLDSSSRKALLDYFDSIKATGKFLSQWQNSSEEGMKGLSELLNQARFPEGPQLCYPLGLDVRTPE